METKREHGIDYNYNGRTPDNVRYRTKILLIIKVVTRKRESICKSFQ